MANLPAAIALDRAGLAHLRGDAEQMTRVGQAGAGRAGRGRVDAGVRSPAGTWPWPSGCAVGWPRPKRHWRPASPGGGRPASTPRPRPPWAITASAWSSATRVAWRPPWRPTGRRWRWPPSRTDRPRRSPASPQVGMAGVLYERDELDAALEHATDGIALCRQLAYTPPLVTGLVTLAWIRQAQGDRAGALDALGAGRAGPAEPDGRRPAQPGASSAGPAGPRPGRRRHRRPLGPGTRPGRRPTSPATHASASTWCWSGCCSPHHAPEQALGLLERLHAQAATQGRTGSVIEIRALQALAHADRRRRAGGPGRAGRGARAGRARGLPARVRRRGAPRWPPCSASCWLAGARSARRRPARRSATILPAWWTPSSRPACRSASRSAAAAWWWRGWSRR